MNASLRWPIMAVVATLGIAGFQHVFKTAPGRPDAVFAMNAPVFAPANYVQLLDQTNDRLALARSRVDRAPEEWLPRASLAAASLSLFRLTGKIDYLDQAQGEAQQVAKLAPTPSGSPELRAEIALARHDLKKAERELDLFDRASVMPDQATTSDVVAMRGDIALYSGRPAEAARLYRKAAAIEPNAGVAMREANLLRSAGDYDRALAALAKATRAERLSPSVLSSIALQAGMIESARGDYSAAQDWYERAETLFPGHWLTALYSAEAMLAHGDMERGIAALEVVARDHARPEAMDMLALIWRIRGDGERSRAWAGRAGKIWRDWTAEHPTAFAAHAAEHELLFGDVKRALQLARFDAQARPYGEAHLLLARTLMANNRARDALVEIERAASKGWRSAQLFALKAQVLTILGDPDGAATARTEAQALNPAIDDPATRFVWLAHG